MGKGQPRPKCALLPSAAVLRRDSEVRLKITTAAAVAVASDSVRPRRRQPARLPRPWDSPGKDTGVGCHFLLQCLTLVHYINADFLVL